MLAAILTVAVVGTLILFHLTLSIYESLINPFLLEDLQQSNDILFAGGRFHALEAWVNPPNPAPAQ